MTSPTGSDTQHARPQGTALSHTHTDKTCTYRLDNPTTNPHFLAPHTSEYAISITFAQHTTRGFHSTCSLAYRPSPLPRSTSRNAREQRPCNLLSRTEHKETKGRRSDALHQTQTYNTNMQPPNSTNACISVQLCPLLTASHPAARSHQIGARSTPASVTGRCPTLVTGR